MAIKKHTKRYRKYKENEKHDWFKQSAAVLYAYK